MKVALIMLHNTLNRCKNRQDWLNKFLYDTCKLICLQIKQQQEQDVIRLHMEEKNSSKTLSTNYTPVAPQVESTVSPDLHSAHLEDIMPRAFDVVIFGASGSVGKFLVEELALVVDKYYPKAKEQRKTTSSNSGARELRDPIQFAQQRARRHSVPRHMDEGIRWAVAGRSANKLSETLCQAEISTGIAGLSLQVPVLLADLNHHRSLLDMCQKTTLVINCVGPYSISGQAIIKACLDSKTHYIDLAHESSFIEQMRRKYSTDAYKEKVYVINGCGFQSMSAEMGLNFTKQMADGQVEEVKVMLNLSDTKAVIKTPGETSKALTSGIVTRGMWLSLLSERAQTIPSKGKERGPDNTSARLKKVQEEQNNNQKTEPHAQLQRKDTLALIQNSFQSKGSKSLSWLQFLRGFDECGRKFCLPISNLTSEEAQLTRGQLASYENQKAHSAAPWKPINCESFITMRNFSETLVVLVWLMIFNMLAKFSIFRKLMRTFPVISSFGSVSSSSPTYGTNTASTGTRNSQLDRDSLNHIKYCQTFLAYGRPNEESGDPLERRDRNTRRKQVQLLVARVVGPEPNHVATASFAIQAALTLILEREHLPSQGGLFTPGAAFAETNIIYQLRKRNIKFEVIKKA